jgi:hypothetical protein
MKRIRFAERLTARLEKWSSEQFAGGLMSPRPPVQRDRQSERSCQRQAQTQYADQWPRAAATSRPHAPGRSDPKWLQWRLLMTEPVSYRCSPCCQYDAPPTRVAPRATHRRRGLPDIGRGQDCLTVERST